MLLLEPVQLTASGRPVLSPGEYEMHTLDKVDLEFDGMGGLPGKLDDAYKGGYVVLTNTRLLWMQQHEQAQHAGTGARHCGLPVLGLSAWSRKSQLGLTGMKLRVVLTCCLDSNGKVVPASMAVRSMQLTLRCRGDAPDILISHLEQLRQQSAARMPSPAVSGAGYSGHSASSAGANMAAHVGGGWVATGGPAAAGVHRPASASMAGGQANPPRPPPVNPSMLQQMVTMGFPYWRAARALVATNSCSVPDAVNFLLEMGENLPQADVPFDLQNPPADLNQAQQPGLAPQVMSQRPGPVQSTGPASFPIGPIGPLTAGLQAMTVRPQAGQRPTPPSQPAPHYPAQPYAAPQQPGYSSISMSQASSWGGSAPAYDPGSEWGSADGSGGGAHNTQPSSTWSNPLLEPQQSAGIWGQPSLQTQGLGDSWSTGATASSQGSAGATSGAGVTGGGLAIGISGLVRREAARNTEAGKALDTAFQDLRALMSMAADMVALAERFRTVSAAQGGDAGGRDDVLDADTAAQLVALGIASPVTRETAGSRYQVELSRQLADWLMGLHTHEQGSTQQTLTHAVPAATSPLARAGGLMPLTDVYCLFNRARGSELVSPDDLLAACKLMQQAASPLSLRQLSSGMLAVQSPEFSDERVCARIASLVTPAVASGTAIEQLQDPVIRDIGSPISSSDVAAALGCSTSLAAEYLLLAEARGVVCRDDGPQGLRFFRNWFRDEPLCQRLLAANSVVQIAAA